MCWKASTAPAKPPKLSFYKSTCPLTISHLYPLDSLVRLSGVYAVNGMPLSVIGANESLTFLSSDRTTPIGSILNGYLAQGVKVEDHAVHLVFSANRWEAR